jgi:leucine-zipper of insertion element IS481
MGVERYVIEAVVREGRTHREVAVAAGVSKAWVTKLVARYRAGGEAAIEARSRRPKSCAHATSPEVQAAVLTLRQELETAGHDAGPHTIHHHLATSLARTPMCRLSPPVGASSNDTGRSLHSYRSGRRPCSFGLKPTYPMRCGKATSPTGNSPMRPRSKY